MSNGRETREEFYLKVIALLLAQHGRTKAEIPLAQVRLQEPVDTHFDYSRGAEGLYMVKLHRSEPAPAPPLPMPALIATHGAPPDVNPAAMQDALEEAVISMSCGCLGCSGAYWGESTQYGCDMECGRPCLRGMRYCVQHVCKGRRRSNYCVVRECDRRFVSHSIVCAEHYQESRDSRHHDTATWLASLESEEQVPSSLISEMMELGHAIGRSVGAIAAGQVVTASMVTFAIAPPSGRPQGPVGCARASPMMFIFETGEETQEQSKRCCRGGCNEPREPGHAFCDIHYREYLTLTKGVE